MNKAFEKIIERFEELHERYVNQYDVVGGNPVAFAVKECKDIVQEVAEEFATDTNVGTNRPVQEKEETNTADMCEWKEVIGFDYMYIKNPHTNRLYSNEPSMKNIYCNTCGKKIKVV